MSDNAATIFDLGYRRYAGNRTEFGARWQVIARNFVLAALKKFFRYKFFLMPAFANVAVLGFAFYLKDMFSGVGRGASAEAGPGLMVDMLLRGDSLVVWSLFVTNIAAFWISATLCAPAIAHDREVGAFVFYFARPVRAWDYVRGKLAGAMLLLSIITLGTPLLLGLIRLGMDPSLESAALALRHTGMMLLVSAVFTFTITASSLAVSAFFRRKRTAMAIWVAWNLLVVPGVTAAGQHIEALTWLNFSETAKRIAAAWSTSGIAGITASESPLVALVAQAIMGGLSLLALWLRMRRAEYDSVGMSG